jgi:hypothetical protein
MISNNVARIALVVLQVLMGLAAVGGGLVHDQATFSAMDRCS